MHFFSVSCRMASVLRSSVVTFSRHLTTAKQKRPKSNTTTMAPVMSTRGLSPPSLPYSFFTTRARRGGPFSRHSACTTMPINQGEGGGTKSLSLAAQCDRRSSSGWKGKESLSSVIEALQSYGRYVVQYTVLYMTV